MAADKFRYSEDSYFKLRGQFDTGRITQEQFDEKLRELMVQDAQGRYWMLGADSGKWYFYDGANWVQGDPLDGAAAVPPAAPSAAAAAVAASTAVTAPARAAAPSTPMPESGRGFPLVPILVGVAIVVLGIAAFLLFQNRDRFFLAQQPPVQITPILPPTITRAPSPTAFNAPTNLATPIPVTEVLGSGAPTEIPTSVPPTNELPTTAVTVVAVITELPTLLPTATVQPTQTPPATVTLIPVTVTNVPPANTPLPGFPPDVYVTALNIDPNPAKKNQNAAFTATFLNTTGAPRGYNWLILLYDPNKNGPNKGFGESTQQPVTIPVGRSTHTINHVPATGPGGCILLDARVGWRNSALDKPIFPNTSGGPVTVSFDVCPP